MSATRTARSGEGYEGTEPGGGDNSPAAANEPGTPSKPRKVDRTGFPLRPAPSRNASATSSAGPRTNGGTNTTITASTSDGRPAEALFRFDRPLEDPSLVWEEWVPRRYAPWKSKQT